MWAKCTVKDGISRDHKRAIQRMIRIKAEMDHNQLMDDLKKKVMRKVWPRAIPMKNSRLPAR